MLESVSYVFPPGVFHSGGPPKWSLWRSDSPPLTVQPDLKVELEPGSDRARARDSELEPELAIEPELEPQPQLEPELELEN